MEIETKRRAGGYLLRIMEMEEERWTKICLRKETRSILNREPMAWGKELEEAMKKTGENKLARMIWNREEIGELKRYLNETNQNKPEQEMSEDKKGIEESEYWKYYKRWLPDVEGGSYWNNRTEERAKEIWARIRVGNISKEGKKGFREMKCRIVMKKKKS